MYFDKFRDIPKDLGSDAAKNEFCNLTYAKRPVYNNELDMCVPQCSGGNILNPVTGECDTLGEQSAQFKKIRKFYGKIFDFDKTGLFTNILFQINTVLFLAVIIYTYTKYKNDVENSKSYKNIFAFSIITYLLISYLIYNSCISSGFMITLMSILLSMMIYMVHSI